MEKIMPPDAVAVSVLDNYCLSVRFENGETRLFDAAPLLKRKCYEPLKSKAFFELADIRYGCVSWPGNIDIDPDWLYQDSIPQGLH